MILNENGIIHVLVIEDVPIELGTIVDIFEAPDLKFPSELIRLYGDKVHFKCYPISSLKQLRDDKILEECKFQLVIVDLHLPEDAFAGILAMQHLRSVAPGAKIVVFSGIHSPATSQEWIDLTLRIATAGIWDFFLKGLPSELVQRVLLKWQKELSEDTRRGEADIRSQQIRWARQKEWDAHYIAFYIDNQGHLRPDPDKFPEDKWLVDRSYISLLLELNELGRQDPNSLGRPFITYATPASGIK